MFALVEGRSATGDNAVSITATVADDSGDIGTPRSDNEDEASQVCAISIGFDLKTQSL